MWRYLILSVCYLIGTISPALFLIGSNFEYEYVLTSSYILLILVPLAGLFVSKKIPSSHTTDFPFLTSFELLWIILLGPLLCVLPGIYSFATQKCLCSYPGFWFWMVLQWYPSWIFAHALHHLILRGRQLGFHSFKLLLGMFFCYITILAYIGYVIWFNPQKRIASLLAGFIHGAIYDDFIAVDEGIVFTRLSHLLLAFSLLSIAWLKRRSSSVLITVFFLSLWSMTSYYAGMYPSTQNGKEALKSLLPGSIDGNGFTIHYIPRVEDKENIPKTVQRLFWDTQFHLKELKAILKDTPVPHVEIYIYQDNVQKKLWFGAGETDVTDVYTPSIHISETSWPHRSLRHELVHALLSKIGYKGIGVHPNMAFTEGIAVALAPEERTLSLDDSAASLILSKRLSDIRTIFSPLFWKESGPRAYVAAGSFINYLIDQYGFEKVRDLYSGIPWENVFPSNSNLVIQRWQQKIVTNFDKEKYNLQAEALYRYPGIFQDICPHSKADLAKKRTDSVFVRFRQPPSWSVENDYDAWLANLDLKDKESKLIYWRKLIEKDVTGKLVTTSLLQPKISKWKLTLATIKTWPPETIEDVEIKILESDLSRIENQREESIKMLDELMDIDKHKKLGPAVTRKIWARWKIEQLLLDEEALQWRRYLAGWTQSIPEKKAAGEPWLLTYLRLRNSKTQQSKQEDTTAFNEIKPMIDLVPDDDLPETFLVEWYRILGIKLMKIRKYQEAFGLFQKATMKSLYATDLFDQYARLAQFYDKIKENQN